MTTAGKIEQGARAKALVEGRAEGILEGRRAVLSKLLTRRFGVLPASVQQALREATEEQKSELYSSLSKSSDELRTVRMRGT